MDTLRKGAFVLSVLVVPVSCSGDFFSEPVICYFLDAFLIIYCIIVTGFFFREKFSKYPAVGVPQEQEQNGIYQELERPNDADPYEVLDPSKRKKKAGKKKKRVTEKDPFESLIPSTSSPPPLSPH